RRTSARAAHLAAGARHQPRQPCQDDDAGLRRRGSRAALRLRADLVGRAQRAHHDERGAAVVRRHRGRAGVGPAPLGANAARAGFRGVIDMTRREWPGGGSNVLPVLVPVSERSTRPPALHEPAAPVHGWTGRLATGSLAALTLVVVVNDVAALDDSARPGIVVLLAKWTPVMFDGFLFNLLISVLSMAVGTALGVMLGLLQVSLLTPVRRGAWVVTQFFRNAPWLVLLFYCIFLIPYQVSAFGVQFP